MTERKVQSIVWELVQTYVPKNTAINLNSRIIADLKLCSDDATQLALDLERMLNVKLSQSEWNNVYTVRDVIHQFEERLRANK